MPINAPATNVSSSAIDSVIEKLSISDAGKQSIKKGKCSCIRSAGIDDDCVYCTEIFQPPPPEPECPLCCMPLAFGFFAGVYLSCCGKQLCVSCICQEDIVMTDSNGEYHGLFGRHRKLPTRCPFCRALLLKISEEEERERLQKRLDANDPGAYSSCAVSVLRTGDIVKAAELEIKAVELGWVTAYYGMGHVLYILSLLSCQLDESGEESQKQMSILRKYYLEMGAKKGCNLCHHQLGEIELKRDNPTLAYKHFCFAAEHGGTESSKKLLKGFIEGHMNKEKYAAVLRAYKDSFDATMSPERYLALKIGEKFAQCNATQGEK